MKVIVLVCGGAADEPQARLEGRTPLEAAKTPVLDEMAAAGRVGAVRILPEGIAEPSGGGHLAILGYDPKQYAAGRGPLEAADLGVELRDGDVAFRCDLVTADGERLVDPRAGGIRSEEAAALLKVLGVQLSPATVEFHPGPQHQHLAVFREPELTEALLKTRCRRPEEAQDGKLSDHWPQGPAAERLIRMMEASRSILAQHEINQVRVDLGENPANLVWFWGQGTRPRWPSFRERFSVSGGLCSPLGLVRGMGRLAGLEILPDPPTALEHLERNGFVLVHVSELDEAALRGNLREKLTAIEQFDKQVAAPFWEAVRRLGGCRVWVICDHAARLERRARAADPVPFLIAGEGVRPDGSTRFGEGPAREGGRGIENAHEILPRLFDPKEIA